MSGNAARAATRTVFCTPDALASDAPQRSPRNGRAVVSSRRPSGRPRLAHIAEPLRRLAVPVGDLSPDPANARLHDERNLEAVAGSLRRFGQQKPIVVDAKGIVIAGNATLEAARRLGWTHVAAVRTRLAGPDRTAYAIADNRTAELATWDNEALARLLADLGDAEGLTATGFSIEEAQAALDALAAGAGGPSGGEGFPATPVAPPALPQGERGGLRHMTFTLHETQAETVEAAIQKAGEAGPFDESLNLNTPGNALARIAEAYLGRC